jgi:hypothetical protein
VKEKDMTTADITTELRQQLRREWIAALRSGEYEQGRGSLCRNGRYCCLGVACAVIEKHFPALMPRETNDENGECSWHGRTEVLPDAAQLILGMRSAGGATKNGMKITKYPSLIEENDWCRTPFSTIADFIEQHPEALFVD